MKEVYIRRRVRFSAAHSYQNMPQGPGLPSGKYRRIHGHNYIVNLTCRGELNQQTGMVVNITDINRELKSVTEPLDGSFLEQDHPQAAWGIPTTENLAVWIWQSLEGKIPGATLHLVEVKEKEDLWASYTGEKDPMKVYVTRTYEFSAAHRLHSDCLSDKENLEIFGKCNNPNGHGHNYGLEVTLSGDLDTSRGVVCDIDQVDEAVNTRVVNRFDHKHLNFDIPEFEGINPTSENVAVVIWEILFAELGDCLHKVCVRETERNYFEYYGERN